MRWLLAKGRATYNETGQVLHVLGINIDITGRKALEEALRQHSEHKFRTLYEEHNVVLESIPDMVFLFSPHMKVIWANRVALDTLPLADSPSMTCHNFLCNCTDFCGECPITKCFSEGIEQSGVIKTSGGKYYDLKANPIKDSNGKGVKKAIVVASDITEKLKMEQEAFRAAHLSFLGELAAGVAHEINNPLNGIINYGQIILDKSKKEEKENYLAGEIIEEGKRIAHIVKSLLSFARGGGQEKTSVFVRDISSDTLALIGSQLEKNSIKIKMNLPDDLPSIFANSLEMRQVFLNILNNASYAINEKFPSAHPDKIIEISGEKRMIGNTPWVRIVFYDHGIGIPEDIKEEIMNPFFTTKPPGKGTGLGLSITYGIIESHDGKINLDSKAGEYTKVIIDLPAIRT